MTCVTPGEVKVWPLGTGGGGAVLFGFTGAMAEKWLESAGIIVNKNMIPFDQRKPMETSCLRIGTPAVATREMGPEQMTVIADFIHRVLSGAGDAKVVEKTRGEVRDLCAQFPLYAGCSSTG